MTLELMIQSKKAREWIDSESGITDGEWTERGVITAISLAEEDARERAIDAYCRWCRSEGGCPNYEFMTGNEKYNCGCVDNFLTFYDKDTESKEMDCPDYCPHLDISTGPCPDDCNK